ncbi:MAG TPA: prephenate dehydrogenase [Bacteroidales bacterium]|nr:prephenate dehydrogenase [Bacteroidales bacterium]
MKKNISIIGTGLIGGSIALGLRGKGNVIFGFDKNPRNIGYAEKMGIVDFSASMDSICVRSDIIIISVPADVALNIIPEILTKSKDDAIVIDVSSTKVSICNALKYHPKRRSFIAAHPMAGTEIGGPQNADFQILRGRKVVICQSELNSNNALDRAIDLFKTLGMHIELMDAETHDSLVAMVSHLPQLVSYGLANTVSLATNDDQWSSLAASGFDSSTRLASSSAKIWVPIINQNKECILKYLNLFIHQMEVMKEILKQNDNEALVEIITQSQMVREKFENSSKLKIKHSHGSKIISWSSTTKTVETRVE